MYVGISPAARPSRVALCQLTWPLRVSSQDVLDSVAEAVTDILAVDEVRETQSDSFPRRLCGHHHRGPACHFVCTSSASPSFSPLCPSCDAQCPQPLPPQVNYWYFPALKLVSKITIEVRPAILACQDDARRGRWLGAPIPVLAQPDTMTASFTT
jgi:hypothetical protein